jgi:hypothetical protein
MLERLRQKTKPAFTVFVGNTPAADVYVLDQPALDALLGKINQPRIDAD